VNSLLDTHPNDPGLSLALAMVAASTAPLLLLDRDLKLFAVSASFCHAFDLPRDKVEGRELFDLGAGEWNVPQLRTLLSATLSGDATISAYEMDLKRPGEGTRRLVINVQRLPYGNAGRIKLLVSVADVTEARLSAQKNLDLTHDNELLLQEIRHRVANSLQIIASVLMQSARTTQSSEVRDQLRNAHNRVMSIADLQQQLAVSTNGTVNLKDYLTKLCETIAASMIADPDRLSLSVVAQDVTIDAGVSVSLGLIVTELVINALKHGFPDNAGGKIIVDYESDEGMWTLSVCDNGVGMPKNKAPKTGGLGTSIVQALARQLNARVDVDATNPGVKVSIVHPGEPLVGADKELRQPEPAV
jgi:two-component sensor histidine kinase